jgi:predicted MFS family arabinose efflux permease
VDTESIQAVRAVVTDVLDRAGAGGADWAAWEAAGLTALAVPEAYDGDGLGLPEVAVLLRACGRRSVRVPVWETLCCAALTLAATMGHSPPAAIASVALMGFFLAAVITALQTRILLIAPKNVDVASATGSATFNSGIGAGALLGGFLLERFGAAGPPAVGAALTALALAILLLDLRRPRRPRPA